MFLLKALVKAALEARQYAYAPYSTLRVGAALLGENGVVYTGCNVENASYGLTCCAERVALFKAVSTGVKSFTAIAIASDSNKHISPCGACRQVLAEFGQNIMVYMANQRGDWVEKTMAELLPVGFHLTSAKGKGASCDG